MNRTKQKRYQNKFLSLFVLFADDFLQLLDTVSGRKHLSLPQAKQMKHLLPIVSLIQYLMSSSVFRPYIVDDGLMVCMARLLEHTVSVDCGDTGVSSSGKLR